MGKGSETKALAKMRRGAKAVKLNAAITKLQSETAIEHVVAYLKQHTHMTGPCLEALRSGILNPAMGEAGAQTSPNFNHAVVAYQKLPKNYVLDLLTDIGVKRVHIDIITKELGKVSPPAIVLRLFALAFGVSLKWKVASKHKATLKTTLQKRWRSLGKKLQFNLVSDAGLKDFWKQHGAFTFSSGAGQDQRWYHMEPPGSAVEFDTVHHMSGAKAPKPS
jgi:hypothetical protein